MGVFKSRTPWKYIWALKCENEYRKVNSPSDSQAAKLITTMLNYKNINLRNAMKKKKKLLLPVYQYIEQQQQS